MRKLDFYPRLALRSLRLNGKFYLPYLLSGVVSAAMLYDILFLNMNTGVARLKGANAVQGLLGFGALIVALFSFALICYTNGFLMKRRQKELGLYNILGMEKRHLARLLFWETVYSALICILGGLLLGILLSKLFLLLLCAIIRTSVPFGFEVPGEAVLYTAVVFGGIYLFTFLLNLFRLGRVRPIELLKGSETGEREPRTKWLLALMGFVTMAAGYYLSVTVQDPLRALGIFFIAVMLVIIGTYCLFIAGSIWVLKALRKNKKFYYQPRHFTNLSGMLHRMKRNGAGLATICILSTMVLVTISTTLCLYAGADRVIGSLYGREVQTYVFGGGPENREKVMAVYEQVLRERGVEGRNLTAFCAYADEPEYNWRTAAAPYFDRGVTEEVLGDPSGQVFLTYVGCDVDKDANTYELRLALESGVNDLCSDPAFAYDRTFTDDGRGDRFDYWSSLGGFFFIGLFLGSLFLMAAVLIVYYKQVSEGYEDVRSFQIMQQVGMAQSEVKATIQTQIMSVFFLPLLVAACHTAGAFPMTEKLIALFGLSNQRLFLLCSAVTLLIFALVYYLVYRLTAREYYRIVKR